MTVCDIKTVHANKTVNAWSGLCLLVLFKTDSLTHSSKNLQVMKKFQSYAKSAYLTHTMLSDDVGSSNERSDNEVSRS